MRLVVRKINPSIYGKGKSYLTISSIKKRLITLKLER